jgi:predicted nucleic acid-binding protein
MTLPSSKEAVVVDANVFIALCAKEPSQSTAEQALTDYATRGFSFHVPHAVIAEVLYVLCVKRANGLLTAIAYEEAIQNFQDQMAAMILPPQSDAAFIQRATEMQQGYGCSHSTDCLYLALAEELGARSPTELLTFDKGFINQAAK